MTRNPITPELLVQQDCALVATGHAAYDFIARYRRLAIDTRNVTKSVTSGSEKVVRICPTSGRITPGSRRCPERPGGERTSAAVYTYQVDEGIWTIPLRERMLSLDPVFAPGGQESRCHGHKAVPEGRA